MVEPQEATRIIRESRADQLLDVEPEDFIFPVLHVQMGIVNKALSHLVAWFEKHVEKLADGHAETRTNLIREGKLLQVIL